MRSRSISEVYESVQGKHGRDEHAHDASEYVLAWAPGTSDTAQAERNLLAEDHHSVEAAAQK